MTTTDVKHGGDALTGRQMDALRELGRYGHAGARQSRLAADRVHPSVLLKLQKAGLAEGMNTTIGRIAWFITDAGRARGKE